METFSPELDAYTRTFVYCRLEDSWKGVAFLSRSMFCFVITDYSHWLIRFQRILFILLYCRCYYYYYYFVFAKINRLLRTREREREKERNERDILGLNIDTFHVSHFINWYALLIFFMDKENERGIFRSKELLMALFRCHSFFPYRSYKILQTISFIILYFY